MARRELAEELLSTKHVVRLATVGPGVGPHVVPLWFVWWRGRMYMLSVTRSRKMEHLRRGTRAAAVVDDGQETAEVRDRRLVLTDMRGVELRGRVVDAEAEGDPKLPAVARAWGRKYVGVEDFPPDGLANHTWIRLDPDQISAWDYGTTGSAGT